MPVYKFRGPDGKLYKYTVDAKDADIEDVKRSFESQFALRNAIEAYQGGKEKAGFFGSFKDAVTQLGLADEAAAYAANPTEKNRKEFLKAAESKYKSVGGFGRGENWEAFKEMLGGSLGSLVAPLGAGAVGGIPGFAATSMGQYEIQALQRQAEEQQAAAEAGKKVPELSLGKATAAAAGEAALDIVPGELILKGMRKFPLVQRLLGPDKEASSAARVFLDALQNNNLSLKGNIVKGVGLGVAFEVPQEVAQQALERWQAGLSLTDDDAKEEFKQAAIGAGLLGGAFGAIGGYGTYRGEKARTAREQQEIEQDLAQPPSTGGFPAEYYETPAAPPPAAPAAPAETKTTPPPVPATPQEEDAEIEAQRQAEYERQRQAEEDFALMGGTEEGAPVQKQLSPEFDESKERAIALGRSIRLKKLVQQRRDLEPSMIDYLLNEGYTDKEILNFQTGREGEPVPYREGAGYEITPPSMPEAAEPVYLEEDESFKRNFSRAVGRNYYDEENAALTAEVIADYNESVSPDQRIEMPSILTAKESTGTKSKERIPTFEEFRQAQKESTEPAEITAAKDLLAAVDKGGMILNPAKVNAVARNLGLEVSSKSKPVDVVERIRQAVARSEGTEYGQKAATSEPIKTEAAPAEATSDRATTEPITTTVDTGTGGGGTEVSAPRRATKKQRAAKPEPTGLDVAGTAPERVAGGEGIQPTPLTSVEDWLAANKKQRSPETSALIERALDHIRNTGNGSAVALQTALDIPLSKARTLRSALLGSGAVVQKTNVKAAKTATGSYFVVEGTYKPEETERVAGVERATEKVEKLSKRQLREQREKQAMSQMGATPFVEKETITEGEERRRQLERLEEQFVKTVPPTLKPDIGKGEYGLRYTDNEGNVVHRAYPTAAERNNARLELSNNGEGRQFSTFSREAELVKHQTNFVKGLIKPGMTEKQLRAAVRGVMNARYRFKEQIGLFGEEEAPMPEVDEKTISVSRTEISKLLTKLIKRLREEGKLKRYYPQLVKIGNDLKVEDTSPKELLRNYQKLQRIDKNLDIARSELGDAKQARLQESDAETDEQIAELAASVDEDEAFAPDEGDVARPLNFKERIVSPKGPINRFKKRRGATPGVSADRVRSAVSLITKLWKNAPNFIVVQSYKDLPENIAIEQNEDTMGVLSGNDVYLVADNIGSMSDLKAAIFHEALGHYGLQNLFGEKFLQTMYDIYKGNKDIRALADAWLQANPDVYPESEFSPEDRKAIATEEVFAQIAESGPFKEAKWRAVFNRVAALVRKFARALGKMAGVDLQYSNSEIADIIAQSHNKIISGDTKLVPKFNNIRYMSGTYKKVMTDALKYVQSGAPSATSKILSDNVESLSEVPRNIRKAKLKTLSLPHLMQMFEKYIPAWRRFNTLVERMASDDTEMLLEHQKKSFKFHEVLRSHPRFVDAFNNLANFINLSQAPLLKEVLDANNEFVRFEADPTELARMRAIAPNSAQYNALNPMDKVLHRAVTEYDALPADMQNMLADIYSDMRRYGDEAFKVKFKQILKTLPPATAEGIRRKFQENRLKYYLPLRREGIYRLEYRDANNAPVVKFYKSEIALNAAKEEAERAGFTSIKAKPMEDKTFSGINAPTGLLKEMMDGVEKALTEANADPETINIARNTVFETFVDFMPGTSGNDLRQDINSRRTWQLDDVTYYGLLGAIEDVVGVYDKAVPRLINQIINLKYTIPLERTREMFRAQVSKYASHRDEPPSRQPPSLRGLPRIDDVYLTDLINEFGERMRFAKNPRYSGYVYAISKANYLYSIAANISSAIINTTIIPMMAWPSLAAKYGVANATKAVGQAMAVFFRGAYTDPRTGRIAFSVEPSFANNQNAISAEFKRLHDALIMRSVTGTAAERELRDAQNITLKGYEGLSAKVNLAMSYAFRVSERFNREVTALATYMLARNIDANGNPLDPSRGQATARKAIEEAIRLNYDVNGATLPETNSGLYQNDIGRIVLTFRTHALNMIINLAMSFNQAIQSINENEPDAGQRKLLRSIARKKLLYTFGSTYMLAGIKGLPLFGAAEVLAAWLMGDDDEPYDLEQEVLNSVGTLGLNGPVNELLNVDLASRTGFYGLIWRDDPKRLAEVGLPVYMLERLAGPTYGLVESARRGFNDLAEGNIVRASEALTPAPIRNMIKGMRYGIEGALTKDGIPIVEDVGAYNSVMQVLGFAPADLAVAQAQRGATYEISNKLANRRVALLTKFYAAMKAGNSEAMQVAMEDIYAFNEANPSMYISGDTLQKSYKERERRAREALNGIYQPMKERIATAQYVADQPR